MKTPIITIQSGADASLDNLYEQIRARLDAQYHNYKLSEGCEQMAKGLTERELGELETYAAYAAHAGTHPEKLTL